MSLLMIYVRLLQVQVYILIMHMLLLMMHVYSFRIQMFFVLMHSRGLNFYYYTKGIDKPAFLPHNINA